MTLMRAVKKNFLLRKIEGEDIAEKQTIHLKKQQKLQKAQIMQQKKPQKKLIQKNKTLNHINLPVDNR